MQQTKTLSDVNENKMYFTQKNIAYYLCLDGTNLWVTLNENIYILQYIFANKKL